jgi:hypothetical protein
MLRTPLSLIKRSQELFLPDSRDQAGTLGEKLALAEVERVIDNLSGMARVYRSIRIPKSQHLGKFEIDLLVVTEEAVLVLEVKHWSGRLRCKRGQWEQERNGERKPLQDPLILNQEKRQAIDQWLATRGIKVPSQLWFAGLVLTHPHVRLETDLSNHPHVWLLSQVRSEIMKLCAPPKRVWWHLRSKGSVPVQDLVEALDLLPTWDRLRLHGGRVVRGDLEAFVIRIKPTGHILRAAVASAHILMPRSRFLGLFFAPSILIKDWDGRTRLDRVDAESFLRLRLAGTKDILEVPLLHVRSLTLGWKDESYYRRSH